MRKASRPKGFTLIELLTVIAIIAVLAAILFPLAGTVREQARASDCMSKMHQLWVSASMYKMDEGGYPPTLYGYVERPDHTYAAGGDAAWVPADQTIYGFLYKEQVKDHNVFRCPDNTPVNKTAVTIAHFPPKPSAWPAGVAYIGDTLQGVCGGDTFGTYDCYLSGPDAGKPKLYYVWDSYDIGPRINPLTGEPFRDSTGGLVFDVHYSRDWTGVTGATDWPSQLKYGNPPDDKTLLAYCTWHAAVAKAGTAPAISNAGTAKKVSMRLLQESGPALFLR